MSDFIQVFEDRIQEIETYLDLLDVLNKQMQGGIPRIGEAGPTITAQQQQILYSSVYLMLYNLVEATITHCIEAVSKAVVEKKLWQPGDLSDKLRQEWVRFIARTHTELNYEHRLVSALDLCEHLVQTHPVSDFEIGKGAGGNWDEHAIQDISRRIGLELHIRPEILNKIKRHIRNDQGALKVIKSLRNELAHGSLSFTECGQNVTVQDLHELKNRTVSYLREVVNSFKIFIDKHEYLSPNQRPGSDGTST